jgi:hypothetical protein
MFVMLHVYEYNLILGARGTMWLALVLLQFVQIATILQDHPPPTSLISLITVIISFNTTLAE